MPKYMPSITAAVKTKNLNNSVNLNSIQAISMVLWLNFPIFSKNTAKAQAGDFGYQLFKLDFLISIRLVKVRK